MAGGALSHRRSFFFLCFLPVQLFADVVPFAAEIIKEFFGSPSALAPFQDFGTLKLFAIA
jgi:hypothetical protein